MENLSLPAGTVVDERYIIIECAGAGGMGTVFKAEESMLDRIVAIKILHPWLLQNQDMLRRFELEGKVLCTLEHPNIMRCYRFGVWMQNLPYLAMEFLQGKTLRSLLAEEHYFEKEKALKLILEICQGVAAAHKLGILHRDLKPENIFICRENESAKILDFGLAKLLTAEGVPAGSQNTTAGTLIGSPHYMSPEQCMGKPVDQSSDVYAITCILFELLSGKPPFDAENAIALLHLHVSAPRPTLSSGRGEKLPEGIQAVIDKGLSIEKQERYQTVTQLAEDLEALLSSRYPANALSRKNGKGSTKALFRNAAVLLVFLFLIPLYWQLGSGRLQMQLFLMQSPSCQAYLDKITDYASQKTDFQMDEYLNLLESRYAGSKHNPSEIEELIRLSERLESAGKVRAARRAKLLALTWTGYALKELTSGHDQARNSEIITELVLLKIKAIETLYTDKSDLQRESMNILRSVYNLNFCPKQVRLNAAKLFQKAFGPNYSQATAIEVLNTYRMILEDLEKSKRDIDIRKTNAEMLRTVERLSGLQTNLYMEAQLLQAQYQPSVQERKRLLLRIYDSASKKEGAFPKVLRNLGWQCCRSGEHAEAYKYQREESKLVWPENLKKDPVSTLAWSAKDYVTSVANYNTNEDGHLYGRINMDMSLYQECCHMTELETADRYFNRALESLSLLKLNSLRSIRLIHIYYEVFRLYFLARNEEQRQQVGAELDIVLNKLKNSKLEFGSDEPFDKIKSDYEETIRAFKQMLGREPNFKDLEEIVDDLSERPFTLSKLLARLEESQEFEKQHEGLSRQEKSRILLERLFGRKASEEEQKTWIAKLENNEHAAVFQELIDSKSLPLAKQQYDSKGSKLR